MTVRLETSIKRFIGLSTDEKPYPGLILPGGHELTQAEMPPGSSLFTWDTNEVWHWNGLEWVIGETPEVRVLKDIKGLLGAILEYLNGSL